MYSGVGTIKIQRESGASIGVTDVLHVPGFGMNLISVSLFQDEGYDVHFVGKKVFIKHINWKKVRQIGVRSNKLFKLQLDSPKALVSNSSISDRNSSGRDLNELWPRRKEIYTMQHLGCLERQLQVF